MLSKATVNLSIKLKEYEDIELETNNLFNLLQHAAKEANPHSNPQRTTNNIPFEIKKGQSGTELTHQTAEKYTRGVQDKPGLLSL
jgi:hypothetical protein